MSYLYIIFALLLENRSLVPPVVVLGREGRTVRFNRACEQLPREKTTPLKYPTIFNSADVAIITKSDLAAAVEFDEALARRNIQAVRPGMEILKLSAKTGEGVSDSLQFLERRNPHFQAAAAATQQSY